MDCEAYYKYDNIRIFGYRAIDVTLQIKHAAISYAWKGIHNAKYAKSFAMRGAENGDRIGIDVLQARLPCCHATGYGSIGSA